MTNSTDRPAAAPIDADHQLDALWATLRSTSPSLNRRDMLRWGAVMTGAAAAATLGIQGAAAGPSRAGKAVSPRLQDAEIETDVTITVPFNPYGQAVTLDPHYTVNWGPFWSLFPNVWGGLVRFDENGKVQLDLAESYEVSEDGRTYTFTIREGAKYASGNPVLAKDFVKSWKRALNPSKPSPMVQFMEQVSGYADYLKRNSSSIGFKAPDDRTVQIKLRKSYSYFLSYLATYVWSVVDPVVLKAEGEDNFPLRGAGTGPWQFTEIDDTSIVMEPNPNHYGGNSESITKIVWSLLTGPTAESEALNLYKSDDAISADVTISLKQEVEDDPTLSEELVKIEPYGTVKAISMDFNQAPFGDVRVRRAFAMAIDREAWASDIMDGTWAPATSFTPPVVLELSGYEPPAGIGFNAAGAQTLLAEAGFPEGNDFPEIVFYQASEDTEEEQGRTKQLLDMISETLGVTFNHDVSRTTDQIRATQDDNGGKQFDIVWWWNVTDTPHLVSEVCRPSSPYMRGVFNWSEDAERLGGFDPGAAAKEFTDLVGKADFELDEAARNDLYRQAEQIVLDNAVYIPIGNWIQLYVQKPWLQGTKQGPWTGRLPIWFDKDVVVLKH